MGSTWDPAARALLDVESDIRNWRRSPLRTLLEAAAARYVPPFATPDNGYGARGLWSSLQDQVLCDALAAANPVATGPAEA